MDEAKEIERSTRNMKKMLAKKEERD